MLSVSSRDTNKRLSSSNDELRVALKVKFISQILKYIIRYENGNDDLPWLLEEGRLFLKGFSIEIAI